MTMVFSVRLESQTESYNFLVHNKRDFYLLLHEVNLDTCTCIRTHPPHNGLFYPFARVG